MDIREQLKSIRENAVNVLNEIESSEKLEAFRVQYLGKKGELTSVLSLMGKLSAEERPVMGALANEVREVCEKAIEEKLEK